MCEPNRYIFGYGSLVHLENLATFLARPSLDPSSFLYCNLSGFRRIWNVAMHNLTDIPGYKCYLDPDTRERLDLHVTFVNIYEDPSCSVNGIAFQVGDSEYERICQRERNYDPIDVSGDLDVDLPLPATAFVAKDEAVDRFEDGCVNANAVVCADYHQTVETAFKSLGDDAWESYQQSTDPIEVPLRQLETVRLP